MVIFTSFFSFFNVHFVTQYSSRDLCVSHTKKSRENNKEQKWIPCIFMAFNVRMPEWVNRQLNFMQHLWKCPKTTTTRELHRNHHKANESWAEWFLYAIRTGQGYHLRSCLTGFYVASLSREEFWCSWNNTFPAPPTIKAAEFRTLNTLWPWFFFK